MRTTSKSPRKVLLAAQEVGVEALLLCRRPCNPKAAIQAQQFACPVLMLFGETDNRGLGGGLADLRDLQQAIGLYRAPRSRSFQKAHHRLMRAPNVATLADGTVQGPGAWATVGCETS